MTQASFFPYQIICSRAEKGQGFLEEEGLTTLSWGAEAGEKVKVISSRHDATVCARSSTGFELLLLINFQPRRWKSFQFGKDRKYANWPYHHHQDPTTHTHNTSSPTRRPVSEQASPPLTISASCCNYKVYWWILMHRLQEYYPPHQSHVPLA